MICACVYGDFRKYPNIFSFNYIDALFLQMSIFIKKGILYDTLSKQI